MTTKTNGTADVKWQASNRVLNTNLANQAKKKTRGKRCDVCGKGHAKDAYLCPHCGKPSYALKNVMWWVQSACVVIVVPVLIAIFLFLFMLFMSAGILSTI